ncbi:MFS general substrate transporter [Stipitochalara longipes BDJ]|nr:MFS general substrate transporter [Stipitochalara longipes BDJ]
MSNLRDEAEQPLLDGHPCDSSSQADPAQATANPNTKYRAHARIVGCCASAAAAGWHDGCIGALIPYLQIYYGGVTDEKISLVFIGSFTGYTLASLLNVTLSTRLGLGRLLILGAAIQGVASAIIAFRPPFLAMAMCYAIAGFGLALQDAQYNTYIARLPDAATKLGIVHAIYGVGALSSPIVATLLMQAKVAPPLFYFTNLAWCAMSLTALVAGFGFSGSNSSDTHSQSTVENDDGIASLRTVISTRAVWAALLFIGLYTGAETGEAGWIVSFLMRERGGGAMSGYASAAFYSGLTSSRVMLLPLTALLTEKRAVAFYALIALVMQIVIWTSPSFLVDFIAVAVGGFVMGPVYPVTVALVTKATPHGYHPGALSLMACVGQSGSALFPFVVGLLADAYGIEVLQPVLVTLFVVMSVLWQLVPSPNAGLNRSSPCHKPASIDEGVGSVITDNSI